MTRLFVYGTLVPGEVAATVLAPWIVGEARPDAVPGVLYDTGRGYPAATFAADANTVVHGAIVELDPLHAADALEALDRYEGREYRRLTVRTAGGVDAHTYAWIASLADCAPVADGRWSGP